MTDDKIDYAIKGHERKGPRAVRAPRSRWASARAMTMPARLERLLQFDGRVGVDAPKGCRSRRPLTLES